jgi:hypothetical protein
MKDEIHDFAGPYQIHTHPDHDIVFIKNEGMNGLGGAYSYDSPKLFDIVNNKIAEHETQLMKWNLLLDRINKNV